MGPTEPFLTAPKIAMKSDNMWSAPENTRISRIDRTGISNPAAVAILGALKNPSIPIYCKLLKKRRFSAA